VTMAAVATADNRYAVIRIGILSLTCSNVFELMVWPLGRDIPPFTSSDFRIRKSIFEHCVSKPPHSDRHQTLVSNRNCFRKGEPKDGSSDFDVGRVSPATRARSFPRRWPAGVGEVAAMTPSAAILHSQIWRAGPVEMACSKPLATPPIPMSLPSPSCWIVRDGGLECVRARHKHAIQKRGRPIPRDRPAFNLTK